MENVFEEDVTRCRVCHSTGIEAWQFVCDECAERNTKLEEELWQEEQAAEDERTERQEAATRYRDGGEKVC